MPLNKWTLTDVAAGIHEATWQKEIAAGVTAKKRVLQGGKQQGVDSVRIESAPFSFEVLPTRGMNLWKIWTGEFEYGWKSPTQGPVHPSFVPLMEPGGLGWLDGFDEVFVRCGLESNGAPEFDEQNRLRYPLHGKIANTPAHKVIVESDDEKIKVIGTVDESRFHFMKMRLTTTIEWTIGTTNLNITDEIENLSASPGEIQMLYHINFGSPLLEAGSRFVAPIKKVVPRNAHSASGLDGWESYSGPTTGYEEQVYFLELAGDDQGNTRSLLKNADGKRGVSILHNTSQLPCYSVWKNTTAIEDGYVTGLEPATNFPNPRSFEGKQGRFVKIPGKGKHSFHVGLEFLTSENEVCSAENAITGIQTGNAEVFREPQSDWCD